MNKKQNIEDKDKALHIAVVVCSACGEEMPDHEKHPAMMAMDIDDVECIDCEMKFRDSADLDMFGG